MVEGTLLENKAQNLPWGLQFPTVATYLSVLLELKGAFLAEMAHLVPCKGIFLLERRNCEENVENSAF